MKKMICMLLALVLMFGVFALPASAEDTAGKIYELPGEYYGPVYVQDGLIKCTRPYQSGSSRSFLSGIIDKTGRIIVPFKYSYLTFPDENGDMVGYYQHELDLERGIVIDPYLIRSNGDEIDLRTYFGLKDDYLKALRIIDGAVLLSTNYRDGDQFMTKYRLFDIDTKKEICPAFSSSQGEKTIICNGDVLVYSARNKIYAWENGASRLLVDLSNQSYTQLQFFDGDWVYIKHPNGEYRFEVSTRVNLKTGAVENLYDTHGIEVVSAETEPTVDVVASPNRFIYHGWRYGFIDLVTGVKTADNFEQADGAFNDGYFVVKPEGKNVRTYYSVLGQATEQSYKDAINFSDGIAFVTDENGETYAIDTDFNRVSENTVRLVNKAQIETHKEGVMAGDVDNRIFIYSEDLDYSFYGDVSLDEKVDVADIMLLKNYIMNDTQTEDVLTTADLDDSGGADVADIMLLKNIIMSS